MWCRSIYTVVLVVILSSAVFAQASSSFVCNQPRSEFTTIVVTPPPNIDYKIEILKPQEDIDYKMIVINPCPKETIGTVLGLPMNSPYKKSDSFSLSPSVFQLGLGKKKEETTLDVSVSGFKID